MTHPLQDFRDLTDTGEALCFLPIGRVLVEEPAHLHPDVVLYPPNSLTPEMLRVVGWPSHDKQYIERRHGSRGADRKTHIRLCPGRILTWYKSAATGIDLPEFFGSALVATVIPMDWSAFLSPPDHETHLGFVARAAEKIEETFDLVRLHYCNPWLPATLPGKTGFLRSAGFSFGLFYAPADHESYIVGGELLTHTLVSGVGLDMSSVSALPVIASGETGQICRHGLRMLTAALEANSETSKFVQLMSLLDYLAFPDEFKGMADVKKVIGRHAAKSRSEFDEISRYFRYLTSDGAKGATNSGLRHNIVHLGRRLEDLIDAKARKDVLRRLFQFVGVTLEDLIQRAEAPWSEIEAFRFNAGVGLGLNSDDGGLRDGSEVA